MLTQHKVLVTSTRTLFKTTGKIEITTDYIFSFNYNVYNIIVFIFGLGEGRHESSRISRFKVYFTVSPCLRFFKLFPLIFCLFKLCGICRRSFDCRLESLAFLSDVSLQHGFALRKMLIYKLRCKARS